MGSNLKKTLLWGGFSFFAAVLLLVPGWLRSLPAPEPASQEDAPAPLPKPEELGIVLPAESFAPPAQELEPAHVIRSSPAAEEGSMDEEIQRMEKLGVLTY